MSDPERVRIADLPTLETRPRPDLSKGKSRMQVDMAKKPDEKRLEKEFRHEVRKRDDDHCRCCKRETLVTMERCPEQAQVHHIHGRLGRFRYAVEHALLLCRECHEKVTGAVNVRVFLFQKASCQIQIGTEWFIDARKPVQFKEAA